MKCHKNSITSALMPKCALNLRLVGEIPVNLCKCASQNPSRESAMSVLQPSKVLLHCRKKIRPKCYCRKIFRQRFFFLGDFGVDFRPKSLKFISLAKKSGSGKAHLGRATAISLTPNVKNAHHSCFYQSTSANYQTETNHSTNTNCHIVPRRNSGNGPEGHETGSYTKGLGW